MSAANRGAEAARENGDSKRSNRSGRSYKTHIISDSVFELESRYEVNEIIGHGAYGVVCGGKDLKTKKAVAVKKIEKIFEHRSLAKRTLREIKLLRLFDHENIMDIKRVMHPKSRRFNHLFVVSELMETDLACVIRSSQDLSDEHCQFFIYQVLRGLKYMHSANVLHRDLKPRNLLVNSNCDLKICDLGLARWDDPENARRPMSNYVATRWYRAPEVILSRRRYTKAVDIWSVGCILAELIGRKPIFPGRDSFHQISLITSTIGTPKNVSARESSEARDFVNALPRRPKIPWSKVYPHATEDACDLLEKLLKFNPAERCTVEEALSHPYLANLHCEDDEPVCEKFNRSEFYFEWLKLSTKDLRELIVQEVVNHYPPQKWVPPAAPLDSAPRDLMRALPKPKAGKRHRRRHSF